MESLVNKNIILGVTGGIAAYKSAEIVRHLKKSGSSVRVVMTASAEEFITPLTMQALSGNRVSTELLDVEAEAAMGQIELAKWAAFCHPPKLRGCPARLNQFCSDSAFDCVLMV